MMLPSMGAVLEAERAQSERIDANLPAEISVALPCLNEANSRAFCVDEAVNAFRASSLSGEVIVAVHSSTDGSIQIVDEHRMRVVRAPERKADHSYDFREIRRFVERFDLLGRR